MKFQPLYLLAAFCAIVLFSSCKNDSAASQDAAASTTPEAVSGAPAADASGTTLVDPLAATPQPAANPAAATKEPPQNAAGVWHYTCPKGCAGGAGAPVPCAKCGTTLAHNQAYHAGNPSAAATPAATPADKTAAQPAAPKPEPAQNKAGVWHYTCPGGCAGGGAGAGACASCGKALAHNQAYHQ